MDIPMTGTAALLELLSAHVPDEEIQATLPRRCGGRQAQWSSAQLLRVLLLLVLTPARSANLLCALLPEQRAWRRFAHLPNQCRLPNARQLHEFRARLTPGILRQFNAVLLQRLMATWPAGQPGVALIDATDLPAATNEYKKSLAAPGTTESFRCNGSVIPEGTCRSRFGFPTARGDRTVATGCGSVVPGGLATPETGIPTAKAVGYCQSRWAARLE